MFLLMATAAMIPQVLPVTEVQAQTTHPLFDSLFTSPFDQGTVNKEVETSPAVTSPVVTDAKVPADVIDFTTWKLQMPTPKEEGSTSVKEISSLDLKAGYDDGKYCYLDTDGSVVFSSPVDGFKTANTSYARSELREMLDGLSKTSNWGFDGTHILNTSQAVSAIPSNGRVVTSQIHSIWPNGDNGPALVKVEYDGLNKQVVVMFKSSTASNAADIRFYFEGVDLNQRFDTEIKLVDGVIYTTVSSEGRSESFTYDFMGTDPNWDTYLNYFKAGCYVQDSVVDYPGERSDVKIYSLTTMHTDVVEDVAIKSIGLERDSIELGVGEVAGLTAVFTPIDTLNKSLTYKVIEGTDVAAVNKAGVVTAMKEGSAVVEVTSVDNPAVKTTCQITVANREAQAVKPIYTQDFGTSAPVDLTSEELKFEANGTTDVSVKQEGDNYVLSITDQDESANAKIAAFFPAQTETTTVSYKIRLDAAGVKDAGGSKAQGSYLYAPIGGGDDFVASADEIFRLRSTSSYQGGELIDHGWVLTHGYKTPEINPEAAQVELGEWAQMTLVSTPNNGTAIANTTDVYINGVKVADKLENNKKDADTVSLVQFYSGTKDFVDFSIDDIEVYSGANPPASLNSAAPTAVKLVPAATTFAVGDYVELEAAAYPVGAQEELTYTVQTPGILAVSNDGLVTGLAKGEGVVRIASKNTPNVYVDYTVNVVDASEVVRVEALEVAKTNTSTAVGKPLDLGVKVAPATATEKGLGYEILEGSDIATVDGNGVLTPLAVGEVVVRVTSLDNEAIFENCTVKIISDKPVGTMVYENDFEKDFEGWTTATSNIANTENVIKDGAFYFKDNSSGGQPKAYLTFDPQADMFTLQFRFKLDADTIYNDTKISALSSAFGTGSITSMANEAFRFKTAGTVADGAVTNRQFMISGDVANAKSYARIEESSIEIGKWYTIAMTTTPDNGTPNANKTDIYIDGVKMVEGAGNKMITPIIDKFIFQTGTSDLTEYWVDDFKIWTGDYTDYKQQ